MKANDILDLISKIIAPDFYESDKDEGMHGGKSLYYTSDMGVVTRVPNHRAYHRTFQDRATKFGMPARIFSIVFEDEATVGNNILRRPIKKPFQIHEYIYPLWQEGREIEEWEVRKIAKAIIESGNGTFQDPTGKAVYLPRWSQNPPQPKTTTQTTSNNHNKSRNNPQQTIKNKKKRKTNESNNMKKNVIKLNENTLRQIVKESVKKVLKESEQSTSLINRFLSGEESEQLLEDMMNYIMNNCSRSQNTSIKVQAKELIDRYFDMEDDEQLFEDAANLINNCSMY